MTPTADALRGLVDLADRAAGMRGTDPFGEVAKQARAALSAFEGRARLRDTYGIVFALNEHRAGRLTTVEAADAIEAHLFGPATREKP